MSTGQMLGAVIGLAVGFWLAPAGLIGAYMSAGMSIGLAVGGIVDPPPQQTLEQQGSRLGDLTTQTAEWGTPIRRLFGTYRLTGNVFWSLDLHETKHVEESGEGKGGGGGTKTETTWYSYAGSWGISFCEGPVESIRKIWFDSVLVYDGSNYSGGLNSENYTFYKGTPDQPIDWYMQQTNADTPAYRHVAYIVFRRIELENYGNKIPTVSVEIAESTTVESKVVNLTQDVLPGFDVDNSYSLCRYPGPGGTGYIGGNYPSSVSYKNTYGLFSGGLIVLDDYTPVLPEQYQQEFRYFSKSDEDNILEQSFLVEGTEQTGRVYYMYEKRYQMYSSASGGGNYTGLIDSIVGDPINYKILDSDIHDVCPYANGFLQLNTTNELIFRDANFSEYKRFTINWDGSYQDTNPADQWVLSPNMNMGLQSKVKMTNVNGDTLYFCAMSLKGGPYAEQSLYFYKHDLILNESTYLGMFRPDDLSVFNNLANGVSVTVIGSIAYIQTSGTKEDASTLSRDNTYYQFNLEFVSPKSVSVASIAEELFLRAGLDTIDLDLTEGTDLVDGYVVSNPMTTRIAIEPVLSAYDYELIEIDSQLKIVKVSETPIDVIDEDEVIDFVEIERYQEVELSKAITILYANKNKDYNIGSQSILRNDTSTVNEKKFQYPMALSDTQGKQIAERYLYREWSEQLKYTFSVSSDFIDLLPGNVVTVNYKGLSHNIRITKLAFATNGQLNIEGLIQRKGVSESTAIGSDTGSSKSTVRLSGPTQLAVLDIPMLDNAYNYEGLYLASQGYLDGWQGASMYKSTNAGADYTFYGTNLDETIIGTTTTELPLGKTYKWDYSSVTVKVQSSDVLYSKTKEDLLNAQNYILIGSEVLQYLDAVDNGDGSFTLSTFLRGRRGTEWAVGSHVAGEVFVFLSPSMMFDRTASLNVETYYKAVTFGDFLEDASPKIIYPEIVCLKPLSPEYVRGERDELGNLTIEWMRRSRDVTGYFRTLTLMENQEVFQMDVINSLGIIVATKTITGSTHQYFYSEAEQAADDPLHAPGDPVRLVLYQMSDIVLRGYGTEAIL